MTDRPAGVRAVGAYLPRLRVTDAELASGWGRDRGGCTRAVPDADEDALTMAVAAGRRALSAGDGDPADVDRLVLATTTPPVEAGALTTRLGAALGVPETATRSAQTADAAAGVRALHAAAGDESRTLVVAADCPRGVPDGEREAVAGAGAAAFLVHGGDPPLRVTAAGESGPAYPGTRFRRAGSETVEGVEITAYDRAALRAATGGAADGIETDDVDAAAVQAPSADYPYRAAGPLGVDREAVAAGTAVAGVGDAGAASVPVSLVLALAGVDPLSPVSGGDDGTPPETLLAAGYGGDGAAVLRLERDGPVPTAVAARPPRRLSFGDYLRRRGDVVADAPAGGGAHVSVPAWRRSLPERYRLAAGRCPECGHVTYPPGGSCDDCGAFVEYESVELLGRGEVAAVSTVAQGGAPPEFREYQATVGGGYATAIVGFPAPDGDATASVPLLVTDDGRAAVARGEATADDAVGDTIGDDGPPLSVGDPVETTFRRLYTQEGVTRYGTKVRPVADAG